MTKYRKQIEKAKSSIGDILNLGKREFSRSIEQTKQNMVKKKLIQRKKEFLAELGRCLNDAYHDGLPSEIQEFIENTELTDIIKDIENIDEELSVEYEEEV